ncbi:MAG: transposase [Jannaschia sp.]
MSNHARPAIADATIFFTVSLADRGSRLLIDNIGLLRAAYGETSRERPFRTDAVVVLPDHLHAVWTLPEGDSDYATRWRLIMARFSQRLQGGHCGVRRDRPRERAIWQGHFRERQIRDIGGLDDHVSYCWNNPVRHGLTDDPFAWSHSSIHRDMAASLRQGLRWRNRAGDIPANLRPPIQSPDWTRPPETR